MCQYVVECSCIYNTIHYNISFWDVMTAVVLLFGQNVFNCRVYNWLKPTGTLWVCCWKIPVIHNNAKITRVPLDSPGVQGGQSRGHWDMLRAELGPLCSLAKLQPQAIVEIQENCPCSSKEHYEPSAAPEDTLSFKLLGCLQRLTQASRVSFYYMKAHFVNCWVVVKCVVQIVINSGI